jgi:type IV secretory pathway protease TraF
MDDASRPLVFFFFFRGNSFLALWAGVALCLPGISWNPLAAAVALGWFFFS